MGSKNSTKVTFDKATNTLKIRFRNIYGAVNHVKVYNKQNIDEFVNDTHRWTALGILPDGQKTIMGITTKALGTNKFLN